MEWTRLDRLACYPWHKPKTKDVCNELNQEIETLRNNRSSRDAEHRSLMEADATDFEFDSGRLSPELAVFGLAEILQSELQLRDRIAAFFGLERRDRAAALDKAIAAHESKQAEIRKRLVSIGYIDVPATQNVVGKITPGMILCHPEVRAACDRVDELRSQPESARLNEQAAEECRRQLTTLKRRALGLAPA